MRLRHTSKDTPVKVPLFNPYYANTLTRYAKTQTNIHKYKHKHAQSKILVAVKASRNKDAKQTTSRNRPFSVSNRISCSRPHRSFSIQRAPVFLLTKPFRFVFTPAIIGLISSNISGHSIHHHFIRNVTLPSTEPEKLHL